MAKGKIIITTEIEYDIDMSLYASAGISTLDEAIKIDIKSASEDPFVWMDMKNAKTVVTGEIKKEVSNG